MKYLVTALLMVTSMTPLVLAEVSVTNLGIKVESTAVVSFPVETNTVYTLKVTDTMLGEWSVHPACAGIQFNTNGTLHIFEHPHRTQRYYKLLRMRGTNKWVTLIYPLSTITTNGGISTTSLPPLPKG
jgi:hypothetical protein